MSNEITKLTVPACIAALVFAACTGNSTDKRAEDLYNQAMQLQSEGRFDAAVALLDSIDHACPGAIEIRKKGTSLRPRLIEQLTNRQLEIADSTLAMNKWRIDSLKSVCQSVSNVIGNYFVSSAEGHVNVATSVGLHARMSPDGRFYLVATAPGHLSMTSVNVSSAGESASSPSITHDGERSERSGANDVITFVEAESQDVGDFVLRHRNDAITVTYSGSRSVSQPLSQSQKEGVASLFETASLLRECKRMEIEKQRLERVLEVARSQIARTAPDSTEVK